MDWYGILKLDQTADDVQIKKQFRKFALHLHQDKNKFAGAADAFKLIGEAQKVLLDKVKRKMHDLKRKSAVGNGAPKQASKPSNVQRQAHDENSSMNANRHVQKARQTAQTGINSNNPTFWTACPLCYTSRRSRSSTGKQLEPGILLLRKILQKGKSRKNQA
ncbi:hypothetical protein AgCh_012266 [Apium graveolens]